MRGGARKGAGRPKGSKSLTWRTRQILDEAMREGLTPLQVNLKWMQYFHDRAEQELRKGEQADQGMVKEFAILACERASAAAPYVHPRLQAIEHTGHIAHTHEQLLDELDDKPLPKAEKPEQPQDTVH